MQHQVEHIKPVMPLFFCVVIRHNYIETVTTGSSAFY